MSEQVLVGRSPEGRPVYAEVLSSAEIVEKLKATSEWEDFKNKFDMSKESNNTLLGMLFTEKLGDDPSVEDYQRLIKTLFRAGGIVLVNGAQYEFELKEYEPEPVTEPEPERDSRGHILGESQKKWKEYRDFAETHSSQECRDRARVDSGFASFRRLNLERESRETPSTQFVLAGGATTESKPAVTSELIAFAEEYRRTPTAEVRKRRNPVFNLSAEQYNKKFDAALAAGLIGR
jgi:hypothetical protein